MHKTLLLAGAALAIATPTLAQEGGEPWNVREKSAYVVTMDGKMMVMRVGDKSMASAMKGAKRVAPGTAFIMSGGHLYMVTGGKMYDRSGAWMWAN